MGCYRGGLLLCGQDHFTRRNAATCSGLWKQSWRWHAGHSPATKRGSPRWHRRDTFQAIQRLPVGNRGMGKGWMMNFNSVWIPETKAHREMDDTNNSVQPYLITMQVKNKDIYVMRTTNAQPLGMWLFKTKLLREISQLFVPFWGSEFLFEAADGTNKESRNSRWKSLRGCSDFQMLLRHMGNVHFDWGSSQLPVTHMWWRNCIHCRAVVTPQPHFFRTMSQTHLSCWTYNSQCLPHSVYTSAARMKCFERQSAARSLLSVKAASSNW